MADITYTLTATERRNNLRLVPGKGEAHNLKVLVSATIELAAKASGTTIKCGRIPSNARLAGISRIYWDDLATSGSPTIDVGLASVNSNITSDPDALSDGHAVSSADVEGAPLLGNIDRFGKAAYLLVNGQTTDPGGELDVYLSVVDAATNATGTVAVELYGYLD